MNNNFSYQTQAIFFIHGIANARMESEEWGSGMFHNGLRAYRQMQQNVRKYVNIVSKTHW